MSLKLTKYRLGELIVQRREKNNNYDVPIRGVSKEGFINPKQQDADTSIYNVFYKNDFVFNPARMELNSIALNLEYEKALCSSLYEIFYIKDESILLPEFLNLHLKNENFTRFCDFIGSGSAREYCRFANISEYEINIPPIEVQQNVVCANRLIQKRIEINYKLIASLQSTAQALYKKTFVDGIDKDHLPDGWRMGTLGEVTDCFDYKRKPLAGFERDSVKKIYPYYGAACLMDYVDNYLFDGRFVLMGEDGSVLTNDNTPVLQYVSSKFWVNNHAHVLRGKNGFDENLLYVVLSKTVIADYVTGGVQAKLNQVNMNLIPILIPDENSLEKIKKELKPIFDYWFTANCELQKLNILQTIILSKTGKQRN